MNEPEGVEMFPEEELKHFHDNVFVQKPKWEGSPYRVWFHVGVQYFQVGDDHEKEEDAHWHAKMLTKAVENLKRQ